MKISILLPTNRTSYSAIARVMEAVSLDADRFEVVVRDNSESVAKRAMLETIKSPALRLSIVPNRGSVENMLETLRAASGDFVLYLADDDWVSARGLMQLHSLGESAVTDESVIGLTGTFLIETSKSTGFFRFEGLDAFDARARLTGYLRANGPNVLYYAAMRRSLALFCLELFDSLPYKFSFHDQLMTLLYLTTGRLLQIDRVVYFYDLGEWETREGTLSKDRSTYREAGLPIEADRLHWLICGLEGALLLRSQMLRRRATYQAEELADIWFSTNFARFKNWTRESGYAASATNEATRKVRDKWMDASQANLHELLLDICDVFELSDAEGARRYFQFWSAL